MSPIARREKSVAGLEYVVTITPTLRGVPADGLTFSWADSFCAGASSADIGFVLRSAIDDVRRRLSPPKGKGRR